MVVSKITEDKKWILFITLPLAIIVLMVCITMIVAAKHPFIIRLEMDNNSLEAVKIMDANQNDCQQCPPVFGINPELLNITPILVLPANLTEASLLCPGLNQTAIEVQCDCAKNTTTPCMVYCYRCQ